MQNYQLHNTGLLPINKAAYQLGIISACAKVHPSYTNLSCYIDHFTHLEGRCSLILARESVSIVTRMTVLLEYIDFCIYDEPSHYAGLWLPIMLNVNIHIRLHY